MYICEACGTDISIHALREEGDPITKPCSSKLFVFLSTPSARRATVIISDKTVQVPISIHALREEGDCARLRVRVCARIFLSTPSARRATIAFCTLF